tara:strand:- start:2218 stop:2613 length:396 start_codon:yes stop_codon:yes gene_type:complete
MGGGGSKDDCSNQVGNGVKEGLYAAGNMIGMGGLMEDNFGSSSYQKVQDQLQQQNAANQQFINQSLLMLSQYDSTVMTSIQNEVKQTFDTLQAEIDEHNEIIQQKLSTNSLYIAFLFILTLIIYTFLYINI